MRHAAGIACVVRKKEWVIRVKLRYGLKSLIVVLLVAAVGLAIAAPFVRRILDEYDLVGVQITPVGWVVLVFGLTTFLLGAAYVIHRHGSGNVKSE